MSCYVITGGGECAGSTAGFAEAVWNRWVLAGTLLIASAIASYCRVDRSTMLPSIPEAEPPARRVISSDDAPSVDYDSQASTATDHHRNGGAREDRQDSVPKQERIRDDVPVRTTTSEEPRRGENAQKTSPPMLNQQPSTKISSAPQQAEEFTIVSLGDFLEQTAPKKPPPTTTTASSAASSNSMVAAGSVLSNTAVVVNPADGPPPRNNKTSKVPLHKRLFRRRRRRVGAGS